MKTQAKHTYEQHRQLVDLVRNNPDLKPKQIAEKTGYSYGYVANMRRNLPFELEMEKDRMIRNASGRMLAALQGVQKAWDENRLLTSDEAAAVRAAIAKATGVAA